MNFIRVLRDGDPGDPPADLLQPVHDLLLARGERRCLHGNCEGRFRLRLRGLRRGPLRAGCGLGRLRALRGRFRLRGGGAEFLEDFLGLLFRDELREALGLRCRELLQREAGVRQNLGGLLRDSAVPQRLNRRRSGHRHSSDGGSSSSTSTSSSEISTYMSFSVRPYEAISCSRSRSFHDGSSPRTSCKMSSMSTARPWTLRDGSTPSSPNLNWMIVSAVLRTVPSSLTFRSSRALIRRRCMYPDRDVRTAVSTRPSRPPIAWKKYSVGWRPLLYDDFTKPFASAPRSPFLKCGRVRFQYPRLSRSPRTACWPIDPAIWERFSIEPRAPERAMITALFSIPRCLPATCPARSRARPRIFIASTSSVSSRDRPGICSSSPRLYDSTRSSTFSMAVFKESAICFFASSGMSSSSLPVVKPRIMIAPIAIFVARSMNSRAASGP